MSESRKNVEDLQVGYPAGVEPTSALNAEIGDVRKLSELQGDEYTFFQFSDDIEHIPKLIGAAAQGVTGAVVLVENEELLEVWLSESSRPFELTADYTRVS